MRRLLIFSLALLCQLCVWAQGGQTATLHHDGEFKTFYSAKAFEKALAEAQPGDIINLSPGTFISPVISVPVTIRGAGIGSLDDVEDVSKARTTISGQIIINIPENEDGHTLSMEGLICEEALSIKYATDAVFSKMRIRGMFGRYYNYSEQPEMNNITFFQCIFDNQISPAENATISIFNSVISKAFNFFSGNMIAVYNSNFLPSDGSFYHDGLSMTNCIIDITGKNESFDRPQCYNCLCIGGNEETFKYNNALPDRKNRLFPTESKAFIDGTFYRLTDEAAAYLGDDGTQVGIYGTSLPFSVKTSYPQIKKFSVAPESTADGKLKIEIEIDAAE